MALSTNEGRFVSPKLPACEGVSPGPTSLADRPLVASPAAVSRSSAILKSAVRDPAELLRLLELPAELLPAARRAAEPFGLFVPQSYLARMRKGDVNDPLLRQVLPLGEELADVPGFTCDAVGDAAAELVPGLLKKYQSRVLLIVTGACAVHCRYCFRRHFPYDEVPKSLTQWEPALEAIAADPSIDEVILSGGDPLTLVDSQLAELARRLEQISHVQRLRIHTRLPIVAPERVGDSLLAWFSAAALRLTPICVVHANHANELDDTTADACRRLARGGVLLLNQAVLLRGVNDSVEALENLCRRLVNLGIVPYYLHQLDRVSGAAHFEVAEAVGRRIMKELRRRLPGYAVPKYVRETAGAESKEGIGF